MRFHFHKSTVKMAMILILVVVLFLAIYYFLTFLEKNESVPEGTLTSESGSADLEPVVSGKTKKILTTLLLLGIDKTGKMEKVYSNINNQQCDFLTLVLLDEKAGTYDLLQLNRDTMTPVDVLGLGGVIIESVPMQLALSHTYGDAMEESCENSVRAVERFLGGIEIDHYLAINMTGMEALIDGIGGVTITIQDDFSKVDPTLIQGETMLLNGKQAMTYIRGRKNVEDQSNVTRTERQKQFMKELLPTLEKNGDLSLDVLADITDHMLTDLSGNRLEKLITKITESTFQEIYSPAGEAILGEEYIEFYADKAELTRLVETLFYE